MSVPKTLRALLCVILLPASTVAQSLLDDLAIDVTDSSREFAFTNKHSAFYYGETHARNTSSWQGFNVSGFEVLDDYEIRVRGEPLPRSSAVSVTVYPDHLKRTYPNGITEQLRPVDSLAMFAVIITSPGPVDVTIIPYFTDGRDNTAFDVILKGATALIPRRNNGVWLAVHGSGFTPVRNEHRQRRGFSPVMLSSAPARHHTLCFGVADKLEDAEHLVRNFPATAEGRFRERRNRMERLLTETHVKTSDQRFDRALAWAKLSLDALIMNQGTRGIFAGLPWFNNYWGRDTFIALPGATLVTGHFREARQILRSFAEFQQRDSASTDFGRIPNIVTTSDTAYNTADGTPRFIIMAREYVERSGDSLFIAEIYPIVLRAIEGTLWYHTDSAGYLTHGDSETWMDAVGPDGPWSPRGNRANDIQALWIKQLEAGVWFATQLGDAGSAQRWSDLARQVRRNFSRDFVSPNGLIDHLRPDGSADRKVRPNQIFASPLLDDEQRARVLHTVTTQLTYEHGVASLSQDDDGFHPFHHYEPYYPKDAAYHNGVVWTWLQGALVSELVHFGRHELAYTLTHNTARQILDRGAVGTQSELLDAVPRPGEQEPRVSGTFSQAWNLAEFVRNFYDDYLGARVQRFDHTLTLRPRLPRELGSIQATINLDGRAIPVEVDRSEGRHRVLIDGKNLRVGGKAQVELPTGNDETVIVDLRIPPGAPVEITVKGKNVNLRVNGKEITPALSFRKKISPGGIFDDLRFLTPAIKPDLQSLRGPDHPLLLHQQVKAVNHLAQVLVDARDPEGDDVGTGAYTYPSNPHFVPGSLDITQFKVSVDDSNAYFLLKFRALSDPGWHPEYGFQLTYVGIAIDEDGGRGSGRRQVRHNAFYTLDQRHSYEKVILVGGGVQVEDSDGSILAAYVPSPNDEANPLGNIDSSSICFAIPLRYLGAPSPRWAFTVLVGAQDDHGGAGLGEFRAVQQERGEWHGGGRATQGDPNVYDVLVVPGQ